MLTPRRGRRVLMKKEGGSVAMRAYFRNIIYGAQQFVTQPESKSVIENSTVTLQCKVKNREGSLQWTRDGLGLGLSRDLPGFARYTMIGASSQVGSDVIGRHCQVMQQIDKRIKMKINSNLGMPPVTES
ncbi:hypothetical protein KUTeg_014493 [Tegillarca granosa]|uniref:Ig-like domain-containing protein n=1 Tax=Tegillarca granosa TaxID=220873 RepID=A0ABQ9ERV2_TEGGR|nr:hypothetical protein KUTeg_014493 [Tegillarca granosa]